MESATGVEGDPSSIAQPVAVKIASDRLITGTPKIGHAICLGPVSVAVDI